MLDLCSDGHREICYQGGLCPCCALKDEIVLVEEELERTERKLEKADEKIEELEFIVSTSSGSTTN